MPNTETELTYHFIDDGEQRPEAGDYIIFGQPSDPDKLWKVEGRYLGSFPTVHSMCTFIRDRMETEQFYPNLWYQNERGTIDLCEIAPASV